MPHQFSLYVEVRTFAGEQFRPGHEIFLERQRLAISQIRNFGGDLIDPLWVNWFASNCRYPKHSICISLFLDSFVVLHPTRTRIAGVSVLNAGSQHASRYGDDADDFICLDFCFEHLQTEEGPFGIGFPTSDVTPHEYYRVYEDSARIIVLLLPLRVLLRL